MIIAYIKVPVKKVLEYSGVDSDVEGRSYGLDI